LLFATEFPKRIVYFFEQTENEIRYVSQKAELCRQNRIQPLIRINIRTVPKNKGGNEMIREVIRPQAQHYTIEIPKEYVNREIEILISPLSSEHMYSERYTEIIRKTSGILSHRKIDPVAWQRQIREQWDNRL